MDSSHGASATTAALWGVAAAVVAIGAGELAAGVIGDWASPVEAVAESVIDRSPAGVTSAGIDTFGTDDKAALVVGILVILAAAAPAVGLWARAWWPAAVVSFGAIGSLGVLASLDAPGASRATAVPSVFAAALGASVLVVVFRQPPEAAASRGAELVTRRGALIGAGALVSTGLVMAASGRVLRGRFGAAASRAAVVLPRPRSPKPPPPAAASFEDIAELSPLFTPNDDFYRIDTALLVPQVPVEGWRLRVRGMVDRPYDVDFDELARMGLVETDITLTCVSNEVGGGLVGNARWLGVPLRAVLDRAGVSPAADQIVGRSVDGYTCGFPVASAYDREAIVAIGMNGEPLPLRHGFPARLVTPGLYGYVSATKWLSEIELTTFDRFDQYWVPRGWAERAPIKTMARIDVPRRGHVLEPGETVVAGVAWAQTRGISKVEVSIDDGRFVEAELAEALDVDTWRQWRLPWRAGEGSHRIVARATDGDGRLQSEERSDPRPDGATGWHAVDVTVRGK